MRNRIELAAKFVELHNAVSAEYKAAFSKVGAKMWHDDDAHSLGGGSVSTITISEVGMRMWHDDTQALSKGSMSFIVVRMSKMSIGAIRKVYIIKRPLTVLDAYPGVTRNQRKWLNAKISSIWTKYSGMWEDILMEAQDDE